MIGQSSPFGKVRLCQLEVPAQHAACFGGSVVSSLAVFGYSVVSAAEYDEEGGVVLEKRRL